jgi:23S rRNA pseudoU1915 N3-methylase RlmH
MPDQNEARRNAQKELLIKAGIATRIAVVILGQDADSTRLEDFASDLMSVPEARLRTILVALPGSETLDERCLPDRQTIWERLSRE